MASRRDTVSREDFEVPAAEDRCFAVLRKFPWRNLGQNMSKPIKRVADFGDVIVMSHEPHLYPRLPRPLKQRLTHFCCLNPLGKQWLFRSPLGTGAPGASHDLLKSQERVREALSAFAQKSLSKACVVFPAGGFKGFL